MPKLIYCFIFISLFFLAACSSQSVENSEQIFTETSEISEPSNEFNEGVPEAILGNWVGRKTNGIFINIHFSKTRFLIDGKEYLNPVYEVFEKESLYSEQLYRYVIGWNGKIFSQDSEKEVDFIPPFYFEYDTEHNTLSFITDEWSNEFSDYIQVLLINADLPTQKGIPNQLIGNWVGQRSDGSALQISFSESRFIIDEQEFPHPVYNLIASNNLGVPTLDFDIGWNNKLYDDRCQWNRNNSSSDNFVMPFRIRYTDMTDYDFLLFLDFFWDYGDFKGLVMETTLMRE
jgi:hypothetical protein